MLRPQQVLNQLESQSSTCSLYLNEKPNKHLLPEAIQVASVHPTPLVSIQNPSALSGVRNTNKKQVPKLYHSSLLQQTRIEGTGKMINSHLFHKWSIWWWRGLLQYHHCQGRPEISNVCHILCLFDYKFKLIVLIFSNCNIRLAHTSSNSMNCGTFSIFIV